MINIKVTPLPSNFISYRDKISNNAIVIEHALNKSNCKKENILLKYLIFFINIGLYKSALDLIKTTKTFHNEPIHQYVIFACGATSVEISLSIFTTGYEHLSQLYLKHDKNAKYWETYIQKIHNEQGFALQSFMLLLVMYLETNSKSECPKINTGYEMMFKSEVMHHSIESATMHSVGYIKQLISMALTLRNVYDVRMSKKQISATAKKINAWTITDIKKEGERLFLKGCEQRVKMKKSKIPMSIFNHFRGQYEARILKDYDNAKMCFVISIVCNDYNPYNGSLMNKVVSLIELSEICCINNELLIGRKSINAASKLCDGYIEKSMQFHNDDYSQRKRKIKIEIDVLKCSNCGKNNEKNTKLKTCTGCMKSYYCDKHCQKRHWQVHKKECDMTWKHLYPVLKKCIFAPLNLK